MFFSPVYNVYVVPFVPSMIKLHRLLRILNNNVVSLWRSFVTTQLLYSVALYQVRRVEESARTLVVLDVDG